MFAKEEQPIYEANASGNQGNRFILVSDAIGSWRWERMMSSEVQCRLEVASFDAKPFSLGRLRPSKRRLWREPVENREAALVDNDSCSKASTF